MIRIQMLPEGTTSGVVRFYADENAAPMSRPSSCLWPYSGIQHR